MIKTENINSELVRFYSSNGYKIQKKGTDEIYDDAIELVSLNVEYVETDMPIDDEAAEEIKNQYMQAGKILLGDGDETTGEALENEAVVENNEDNRGEAQEVR